MVTINVVNPSPQAYVLHVLTDSPERQVVRLLDPVTNTLTLNMTRLGMSSVVSVEVKAHKNPPVFYGTLHVGCAQA